MRVIVGNGTSTPNAPFNLVPNQYTLLGQDDMVFVTRRARAFGRSSGRGTRRLLRRGSRYARVRPVRLALRLDVRTLELTKFSFRRILRHAAFGGLSTICKTKASASRRRAPLVDPGFSLDWDTNFSATAIGGGDWAYPLYLPTEAATSW